MREIHEIQERLYEEEKSLSREERLQKIRREADEVVKKYDLKFKKFSKAA